MSILKFLTAAVATTFILAVYVLLPLAVAFRGLGRNWAFGVAALLLVTAFLAVMAILYRIVPRVPGHTPKQATSLPEFGDLSGDLGRPSGEALPIIPVTMPLPVQSQPALQQTIAAQRQSY